MTSMVSRDEMVAMTMDHWRTRYPKEYEKLPKKALVRDAQARADLTRMEMDTIKQGSPLMSDAEAWTESMTIFCLQPPPELEDLMPDPEVAKMLAELKEEDD
jgi:hypothetical protein